MSTLLFVLLGIVLAVLFADVSITGAITATSVAVILAALARRTTPSQSTQRAPRK